MNTRLEGWKLVAAVLIPAAIIGTALFFAIQALTGDDNTSVDASQQDDAVPTATATPLPVTNEVAEPTTVPTPTPIELPTPLPLPSATPAPDGTPTPDPDATATPAPAPAPTSAPSNPSPPSGGGATPTPTVDPNVVTITCAGASFPISIDVGESIPELSAAVSPPEKAATMNFLWNLGNGTTVGAPNTGTVTYGTEGNFPITLVATDSTTSEVQTIACGTVRVGGASAAVSSVACQVRPNSSAIKWEDATPADLMRVTTTWSPAATMLDLQYEFEINDPIIFSTDAVSGDSLTRAFSSLSSTVKVFWRDEASGETGRISCPAFQPPTTYNEAVTSG